MFQNLATRYHYATIILRQLVKTEFKLRYQNSFLGYLWSLLKPLFLFAIMYAVFVLVLNVNYGVPHSGVYLLLGIVIWTFFAEMTGGGIGSIVGRGDLLRKINFPRYVLVLSGTVSALINVAINMVVVMVFMLISRVQVDMNILLAPFLFLELYVLGVALAFFLSALYVKLRDTNYIWEIIMQALFYATPIFYPLVAAPAWAQKIIMLSPLSQIIQDLRYLLVSSQTTTIDDMYGTPWIRLVPIGICAAILVLAASYFRARSKYFAEEI
jgi:ABC-2 type transport system permease protein